MCGRYVSTRTPEDLAQLLRVTGWRAEDAPVQRELRPLRWGLVPSWTKDEKSGARMINARVETLHEKPAFRRAFTKRQCLLPEELRALLTRPAGGHLAARPVSTAVNNVRNNGPRLLEEVTPWIICE